MVGSRLDPSFNSLPVASVKQDRLGFKLFEGAKGYPQDLECGCMSIGRQIQRHRLIYGACTRFDMERLKTGHVML